MLLKSLPLTSLLLLLSIVTCVWGEVSLAAEGATHEDSHRVAKAVRETNDANAKQSIRKLASLHSPDRRIHLAVESLTSGGQTRVAYRVSFDGKPLLDSSSISFIRDDEKVIGDALELISVGNKVRYRGSWKPLYGERSRVTNNYNEIKLNFRDSIANCSLEVVFRCYDEGIAFHTQLAPKGDASQGISLSKERSEFRFFGDPVAWRATNAQGPYDKIPLSQLGENIERPLVLRTDKGIYAAVAEAKLVDYARMNLSRSESDPRCLVSHLEGPVRSDAPLTTPWRLVMIGESPGELLESNDIILNLSEPCAIADTSWIKPGKVLREITLTTEGGVACIDFAAKNNFSYVEFDAGWYGNEYENSSDATTISLDPKRSAGPFDLHYLIDYAKQHDIGVIVYVNRRALERQLDDILPLYKSWGIKGVKYGFVQVGPQKWTSWLHEAVRKAADHQLMVDIHDIYRPTGFSRTYPNLLNQEGVRGDEETPPTDQTLTSLFTRSLAGAADFTVCYFDDRVAREWTHAHQLAKAVCFYGPWQFIYWYDTPLARGRNGRGSSVIHNTPELEFFREMPTVWDDLKVVHGEIGEYAVIARRSGDQWFLGAMTNQESRSLSAPLTFLDEGKEYIANIYSDDPTIDTITQVRIDRKKVNASTTLDIAMQSNGGQAIRIVPVSRGGIAGE